MSRLVKLTLVGWLVGTPDLGAAKPIEKPGEGPRNPAEHSGAKAPPAFKTPTCEPMPHTDHCYFLDQRINEASGLAASLLNPGVLWTHNDSGPAQVFAINVRGEILATVQLANASNLDFEDIGIIRRGADNFVVVGDIGDKDKRPGEIFAYRFQEPTVDQHKRDESLNLAKVDKLTLTYDKKLGVLNFESLMIDPRQGDLYIFQKRGHMVFRAASGAFAQANSVLGLELIATAGPWSKKPSGASFSPLGSEFIVRDEKTAWLYQLRPDQSVENALGAAPAAIIPMPDEYNGEGIAFDELGQNFYTISETKGKKSEKIETPIWFIQRAL